MSEGQVYIKVICDDTNVFALLSAKLWDVNVFMQDFGNYKTLICFQQTVECHKNIVPSILAGHTLKECDTVPIMFDIHKGKALNALSKFQLDHRECCDCRMTYIIKEAEAFVAACYGLKNISSSENR